MEWLPIESAPKDGRDLWLYTPSDEPAQVVGYWADSWGGWNWRDSVIADCAAEELLPTHWMPLPEPPK